MRLHYLQHVPFEDLANIGVWAKDYDHEVSGTQLFKGRDLPDPSDFDLLVILGGPMNIYEEDKYPWLADEKRLIARSLAANKVVLGLCLGAQLTADVLGGKVARNQYKEIGWHKILLTPEAPWSRAFRGFPDNFTAFEWHGDTFELPPGAVRLGVSKACANQAFELGQAIGLQFHLEYSAESIQNLIDNCGDELVDGRFIQKPEEMLPQEWNLLENNTLLELLMRNIEGMIVQG